MNKEMLRARLKELESALKTLVAGGFETDDDFAKSDEYQKEIESIEKRIAAIETAERAAARLAGTTSLTPQSSVPAEVKSTEGDPNKFRSFGEQLQAIAFAQTNKDLPRDGRLVYRAPTGANVGVPSEGGFLVQQDFSTSLLQLSHEVGLLASRTTNLPISENSNGIKLPAVDETSRATGSRWGGIQVYMAAEADTVTATKPKFREIELSLNKMMGLGYVTDEILKDAAALEAILKQGFAEEIAYKTDDLIINGTGSGQPLGFLNAGSLITVDAESGQAASTLVAMNVLNMYARLTTRAMRNAVWLTTQECLPQLWTMVMPGSNVIMYQPPGLNGNIEANAPYGTLLGRPIMLLEQVGQLGTAGDLILADLSAYLMIDKDGVNTAESMHVRFLYDEMVFRITYRLDGQPAVHTPLTPANGGPTQSPFVALAAR